MIWLSLVGSSSHFQQRRAAFSEILIRVWNGESLTGEHFMGKGTGNHSGKEEKMEKWQCSVCGYIYDPEQGDPDNGVNPGTPFGDLPEDWVCPVCGASKDEFAKV